MSVEQWLSSEETHHKPWIIWRCDKCGLELTVRFPLKCSNPTKFEFTEKEIKMIEEHKNICSISGRC